MKWHFADAEKFAEIAPSVGIALQRVRKLEERGGGQQGGYVLRLRTLLRQKHYGGQAEPGASVNWLAVIEEF